ncbi:MAG: hypothetical protein MR690_00570 [Rikenellaceae bacterium]|nr:hypothetical protein [Rikenellaceae bacterium]
MKSLSKLFILMLSGVLMAACQTEWIDVVDDLAPIPPVGDNTLPAPGDTSDPVRDDSIKQELIIAEEEFDINCEPSSERWCGPRGVNKVKFKLTEKYLYSFIEVDESKVGYEKDDAGNLKINLSSLSTLAVWIDADGISESQGGGWFNSEWKGYEYAIKGEACVEGVPVEEWLPECRDVASVTGDNFGLVMEDKLDLGYGKGFKEGDILRYFTVIDREKLGIDGVSSLHVNITLNLNDGMDERCVIASRSGYQIGE